MKTQRSKHHQPELFWPRVVMRKWLNISTKDSDFSADTDEDDIDGDSDTEEFAQSQFRVPKEEEAQYDPNETFPRIRRRKSETFRAQYINTKEVRICVGTWNVGGKLPPDDLDIDDWIDMNEPADIYVLGLQEIVPLTAGNIFGAEDSRPVSKWENIIRGTLNRIRHTTGRVKSLSDPPSPSKFKPSEDIPDIEEEITHESDSDVGEEVYPLDDENNGFDEVNDKPVNMFMNYEVSACADSAKPDMPAENNLQRHFSSPKRFDRLYCLRMEESKGNVEAPAVQYNGRLTKMLSGSERIGLSWPEPPLNLMTQKVLERPNSLKTVKSFKTSNSFRRYSSFKPAVDDMSSELALLAEIDIETLMKRKRRSSYVRMVSKQMVGIFLTIWVRRSLRRHIQNVRVSTVGVGVMGFIGNKGSVSVSMSIHQTLFCFVCTHLTSGEKDGDELKRNADVHEIHRRTHFRSHSEIGFPKSICDHERIIWLGDLNYRINLPYEKTRELISKKQWSKLAESDQLLRELRKGRAFDGWSEGTLIFAPTYKYELNSEKYYGEDPKVGRRNPSWCDRILSYGKGMRLLNYRRNEIKMSDHRPVTATYMAEVEVFSPRKLQRALTLTDAEIENEDVVAEMGINAGIGCFRLEQKWRVAAFGVYGYMNFTKNGFKEHSKNFKPEDMQARIEGKNCVVTGANAGIGYATAEGLASRGATVYMVCRSKEKGETALSAIRSKTGNENVHLELCDLSSITEIKSFANRFSLKNKPVHVLVNNAGLLENNRLITSEGFELNFAVNVLGTYTITESMVPLLEKAAPDARVITVSSGGMYTAHLTDDLEFNSGSFDGMEQYARNKRVQVALTEKWSEMYKEKGIGFYSMHPGWAETPGVAKSMPSFNERLAGNLRTSEEGADTVLWLALQPKEKLVSGSFYFDRAEAPKHLKFAATAASHARIDPIVDVLRSMANLR